MLPTQIKNLLAADGWTLHDDEARCGSRRITFFSANRATTALTKSLRAIVRQDAGKFRHIAVVIAATTEQMNRLRAGKLPRVFFTSLEELRTPVAPVTRATLFNATILANTPVGTMPHGHYRLVFDAPELGDNLPPQFFMMDVLPVRTPLGARAVRRAGWHDAVDWTPQPLLKRPFGLCRAYRPNFPSDYLKRLALPASFAPALHLPKADRFDMLYKVLTDGLGTNRMTQLRRGDRVHMVGPLGQPFDVRPLRAAGVEEVHIIGGGVGMAPLILLVESLRFFGFRVKIFLGMATLESLRYRDELAATFGEKSCDAYVYVDDLLAFGVAPGDIFLAGDRQLPRAIRRIPPANLFHGLVPEQYQRYLQSCYPERSEGSQSLPENSEILRSAQNDRRKKIVAFTCGPNRMMEVMTDICRQADISLKVLLEKRMGCGIGVCFSCVQKVRRADGAEDYVRVCKDGPVFDAKDILWNTNSKPNLAACNCAARC